MQIIFLIASILFTFQIRAEDFINEIVIFKLKNPSKGIEFAHAIVKDIKSFNDGIVEDKLYQSVNDPTVIAQCITWKSIEKAKEASSSFDTFPSAADFTNQSGEVIFFEQFKQIK